MNVLLIEDDFIISSSLAYYLKNEGFQIDIAASCNESLQKIRKCTYQLILLDVTLKDGNGFELFHELKQIQDIPVIFLTALDDEINVVHGFELGADDYITKPFRAKELLLRMKAVLRRCNDNAEEIILHHLKIDLKQAKVYKNNELIFLTALEYKLLLILIENKGKVINRDKILADIWDVSEDFVNDNTLTVYIKRLREKIEDNPMEPQIIRTVRGIGYKIGD